MATESAGPIAITFVTRFTRNLLLPFEYAPLKFRCRTCADPPPGRAKASSFALGWNCSCICACGGNYVLGSIAIAASQLASRTQITGDGLPKTSVLSDGSHLYLSETLEGRHIISKVSMNDSPSSRPGRPFTEGVGYAMAPDRSSLLLSGPEASRDTLWAFSLTGAAPLRLQATGRNATWAPDGQHIAYARTHPSGWPTRTARTEEN